MMKNFFFIAKFDLQRNVKPRHSSSDFPST